MPVSIGPVRIDTPYILAPMAGIGDPPFRRLCRKGGAGMVCAEMVSANAIHYGDERSRRMLAVYPDEHPVSMQIFGSEPERLAEAAKAVQDGGADIVDLNCGCPVPKIVKNGAGIALMGDESLFSRCVSAMVKAVTIPVTVKMRVGIHRGVNLSARFARLAREAGAAALSVHARVRGDHHSGPADLDALAETVAAAGLPVFGNGGVASAADARLMMERTGCVGVLIGQAAVGNPLIFGEMATGSIVDTPRRFALLREHAQLIVEYYGEALGIRRFRKYIASYVKGVPGAAEFRRRAISAVTLAEVMATVEDYENSLK